MSCTAAWACSDLLHVLQAVQRVAVPKLTPILLQERRDRERAHLRVLPELLQLQLRLHAKRSSNGSSSSAGGERSGLLGNR